MLLNLGSGQRPFAKPWINVDCQERWNPDVVGDAASLPQFADGSASVIVLWHVIEHFGCGESDSVIKESHRILCDGGVLIVATPDLRALSQRWLLGQIDDQIYTTNLYGAFMGDPADRHKWGWSQLGLMGYIEHLGPWSSVGRFSGPPPAGSDISVDWWMATVEAIK